MRSAASARATSAAVARGRGEVDARERGARRALLTCVARVREAGRADAADARVRARGSSRRSPALCPPAAYSGHDDERRRARRTRRTSHGSRIAPARGRRPARALERMATLADDPCDVALRRLTAVGAARPRTVRERDPVAAAQRRRTEPRIWLGPSRSPRRRGVPAARPAEHDARDGEHQSQTTRASTGHAHTIRACASSPSASRRGSSPRSSGSAAAFSPSRCSSCSCAFPSASRRQPRSLAIAITATAGVVVFSLRGEVEVEYAALVGLPAAVGALAGTSLQQRDQDEHADLRIRRAPAAIGVWLLVS